MKSTSKRKYCVLVNLICWVSFSSCLVHFDRLFKDKTFNCIFSHSTLFLGHKHLFFLLTGCFLLRQQPAFSFPSYKNSLALTSNQVLHLLCSYAWFCVQLSGRSLVLTPAAGTLPIGATLSLWQAPTQSLLTCLLLLALSILLLNFFLAERSKIC